MLLRHALSKVLKNLRLVAIKSLTGFTMQLLPINYLGCHIYKGRITRRSFLSVILKMRKRVEGWQGKYLSMGTKLILIKTVLMALPIYLISLLDPPAIFIIEMHRILANLFWNDSKGEKISLGELEQKLLTICRRIGS